MAARRVHKDDYGVYVLANASVYRPQKTVQHLPNGETIVDVGPGVYQRRWLRVVGVSSYQDREHVEIKVLAGSPYLVVIPAMSAASTRSIEMWVSHGHSHTNDGKQRPSEMAWAGD